MDDLISRQAAIDAIKALWNDAPSAQHVSAMFDCEDAIRALPSAQPVTHGKWIPRYIKIAGQDYMHGMQCSVCTEPALDAEGDDYLTDYCPNCGARMDGNG